MEKNFQEMLDSLPTEQKQPFIDHFVQTLLGKARTPLILTTSKTISNDANLEDRIRLTGEIYQIDPNRIDKEKFLQGEMEITESKKRVKEIIKNYFGKRNNTGQRNKDDELISLGKFLYTTQIDFRITPMEAPDFILDSNEVKIGLEHTRLEAGQDKAYIAEIWKKYLKDACSLVLSKIPELNGVANLTLDADYKLYDGKSLRDFKEKVIKDNTNIIKKELVNYMLSVIQGSEIARPSFVKEFSYQHSNEPFSLKYNQDYFVRNDFTEILLAGIQRKEKKLNAYRENTDITECWLLLVYGDANLSSGFKVAEYSLTVAIDSKFDRIFILNSFNLACFELEKGTSNLKYIAKKQFCELLIKPI